jgi:hypothetical protein
MARSTWNTLYVFPFVVVPTPTHTTAAASALERQCRVQQQRRHDGRRTGREKSSEQKG